MGEYGYQAGGADSSEREKLFHSEYLKALGVSPNNIGGDAKDLLREAYIRAHDIRKFEINLYCQRSSYFWTLQAAALGGLALIASAYAGSQS